MSTLYYTCLNYEHFFIFMNKMKVGIIKDENFLKTNLF